MYGDYGWGGGRWLVMVLMMLLFWGALAVLVVWLVRSTHGLDRGPVPSPPAAPPPSSRAHDLLAERYARGEIDEDEYIRRRAVLDGGGSGRATGG